MGCIRPPENGQLISDELPHRVCTCYPYSWALPFAYLDRRIGRLHEFILRKPTQKNDWGDDQENFPFFPAPQTGSGMDSSIWGHLGMVNDELEFGVSVTTGREQPSR